MRDTNALTARTMSKTPQAIRGTQDIFGAEAEAFAFVVETFERVRKLYEFDESSRRRSRAVGALSFAFALLIALGHYLQLRGWRRCG